MAQMSERRCATRVAASFPSRHGDGRAAGYGVVGEGFRYPCLTVGRHGPHSALVGRRYRPAQDIVGTVTRRPVVGPSRHGPVATGGTCRVWWNARRDQGTDQPTSARTIRRSTTRACRPAGRTASGGASCRASSPTAWSSCASSSWSTRSRARTSARRSSLITWRAAGRHQPARRGEPRDEPAADGRLPAGPALPRGRRHEHRVGGAVEHRARGRCGRDRAQLRDAAVVGLPALRHHVRGDRHRDVVADDEVLAAGDRASAPPGCRAGGWPGSAGSR